HDDGHNGAYELDRSPGAGLFRIILAFQHAFELEALIVADSIFDSLRGHRISRAYQHRRVDRAIKIRGQLIGIAPDFRFVGGAAGVEHTHHFPGTFADPHAVANVGLGKALVNGLATVTSRCP